VEGAIVHPCQGRRKREEGRRKREEIMNHKGTKAQRKKL